MPVDIRSFFSKAPASSKKKDSNASASISSNNKTSKVENKPKVAALASATKVAAAKSATKIAPGPSQKKQVVNVEEEKPKEKEKPKENKRKVIIESSDDDEPMEVSAKDFYQMASAKKAALKSPPKKSRPTVARLEEEEDSELEPSPSPVRKSPRKKVISVKKPVIQSCNDDSSSQNEEDEKPKAKRKLPPKKSVTTPKKARQEKLTPLAPGLELDEFNTDNLQVPECLQGRTFVLTGVLDNLHRDDAMDLIKTMGGRVTTAVSGKTDYLVVGAILEDGRSYTEGSKYKKALQLDSAQICMGEKQLYGLCHLYHAQAMKEKGIEAKPKPVEKKLAPTTTATAKPPPAAAAAPSPAAAAAPANPYAKTAASVSNPYAKKPGTAAAGNPYAKSAASNPYAKSNNPYANKSSAAAAPIKSDFDRNSLWVDKHAPQRTDEILGNKDNVTKVQQWLQSWERTFNNSKSYGKAFSNPKGPWKAALMSGPPGIGKTTTATLVAKEAGRDLLEFNASDARSKKALQNNLGDITGSQAINFQKESDTNNNKKTKVRLRCIVMDEVDGMGAGDRSGMAELIQMIKKSHVPIICICNDRQSLKMKSLLPYCLDLRFRRPTKNIMAARAVRIAELEGMTVERNAAEAIAESCGNDVRQVLNCMQMWSNKDAGHASLTYKGLKEREHSINKDEILRVGLFDAAKTIMEGRRNLVGADNKAQVDSLFKRANAFFVDYSLVGLLVQQNYPKVMVKPYTDIKMQGDPDKELEFLEQMHSASLAMSDYAMVEHNIRGGDMNWSLLPTSGMLTVKTGYHAGGETGGYLPGFPEFTAWMGKNSSKGKKVRLLQELHHHMNYKISGGTTELRQTYLPILRERFMMLLKSGEEGASTKAIELMDEYGLSREDVMEKFDEFVMGKESTFADLDSKQKAALTREYNQGSHKSQALVSEQGGGGGTRKKKGKRERDPADLDAIDEDVEEESDVEDEVEDMKKLQEKFKKKGRKKAATKKAAPKGGAAKKPKSKKK